MKQVLLILLTYFVSLLCRAEKPTEIPDLKYIFDKYQVDGSILIYDLQANSYSGYQLERCNTPFTPASSFKIVNTLIALETGVVTAETIFPWDGEKMRLPQWEQDLDITGAFQVSSVPVYQEIARRIGVDLMQHYLRLLHYGEMDVHEENIDKFWLEGNSGITCYQQVYFLQHLYKSCLPVSEEAMAQTRRVMQHEKTDRYVLSGKTGWAVRQQKDVTWFVGWIEVGGNTWIFVTNLETDANIQLENFTRIRIDLTKDVFAALGIIK